MTYPKLVFPESVPADHTMAAYAQEAKNLTRMVRQMRELLAFACGGYSQVSDRTLLNAVAGNCTNHGGAWNIVCFSDAAAEALRQKDERTIEYDNLPPEPSDLGARKKIIADLKAWNPDLS